MHSLTEQLERALKENAYLIDRVAHLEQQIAWFQRQVFGRSCERAAPDVSPDQSRLFDEAEVLAAASCGPAEPAVEVAAHERKPGRRKLDAKLPRIEITHDLSPEEKVCAQDGTVLERIGEESSEQLEIIPGKVRVLKHIRPKYSCPCCRTGVFIAPVPAQILPKTNASPSLLAHIATTKYVDAVPQHRQEKQLARYALQLSRATMATWMVKLGTQSVVPIINLLNEQLLSNLEPHGYLSYLFAELPKATGLEHFEVLLPWNVKISPAQH